MFKVKAIRLIQYRLPLASLGIMMGLFVAGSFFDSLARPVEAQINICSESREVHYGESFALRSFFNRFLVAEMDGSLKANRESVAEWEWFIFVNPRNINDNGVISHGDSVALRSIHDKFMVAEQSGEANANRDRAREWETWVILDASDLPSTQPVLPCGSVALRSYHGTYLGATPEGKAEANRTWVREWETWTLRPVARSVEVEVRVQEITALDRFDSNSEADFFPVVTIREERHRGKTVFDRNVATRSSGWWFRSRFHDFPGNHREVGHIKVVIREQDSCRRLIRSCDDTADIARGRGRAAKLAFSPGSLDESISDTCAVSHTSGKTFGVRSLTDTDSCTVRMRIWGDENKNAAVSLEVIARRIGG